MKTQILWTGNGYEIVSEIRDKDNVDLAPDWPLQAPSGKWVYEAFPRQAAYYGRAFSVGQMVDEVDEAEAMDGDGQVRDGYTIAGDRFFKL
jgi:hypothetical protein